VLQGAQSFSTLQLCAFIFHFFVGSPYTSGNKATLFSLSDSMKKVNALSVNLDLGMSPRTASTSSRSSGGIVVPKLAVRPVLLLCLFDIPKSRQFPIVTSILKQMGVMFRSYSYDGTAK
jgi:hypothetical protein